MNVSVLAGGAGFIGANLCPKLLAEGRKVVVIDNLSRGRADYLQPYLNNQDLFLIEADLTNSNSAKLAFTEAASIGDIDEVWHLAANSDIPAGVADITVDLKDTFHTSVEILRCMKSFGIGKLFFASSSAIYGDHGHLALHESIGPLLPISNYGAMKLASEALISAAVEDYLDSACLFRFPNVVGIPATHGVIVDLVRKLKANSKSMEVLGDGSQRKSYLHVSDLISAMLMIRSTSGLPKVYPINIGPVDDGVYVSWIADQVVKYVSPKAQIHYGTEKRGWVGDVPKFRYSTDRLQAFGWKPSLGSQAAVLRAIYEIAKQEGF